MSDHIKISGPKALSLTTPNAPVESDHKRLWDAIIRFQERPSEVDLASPAGSPTVVSSLDSLKSQTPIPQTKGSGGFKIKRELEEDPKIVRPFVLRTKSSDDES